MALITKIQQRSGLAVTIIVVAIILFIVGGDLLSNNSIILGGNTVSVGTVDGDEIDAKRYQTEVDQIEFEYQLANNKNANEQERQGFREQAWNLLLNKVAFGPEYDNLGIKVTEEEVTDMVQGENIHPGLKQAFSDPNTGQVDRARIQEYLRQIDQYKDKNEDAARQYAIWINFERKLPDDRKRTKYEALLSKTVYVTSAEAEREYTSQTAKASGKFFYAPYYAIPDSAVNPTDDQLAKYLADNKSKYRGTDSRGIDYVSFPITPSGKDSASFNESVAALSGQFETAEDDTLFARSNSDAPEPVKLLASNELPADISTASLEKGKVYGPFTLGNKVTLYKVKDIKNEGGFNARASHILIKWNTPDDTSKAAAKAKATKILNQIKGGASFEEMARLHGTDGTASQGGDLGWFGEGRMVPKFQEAVFGAKAKGLLPTLTETEFGYHLIKVTEPKTNLKYQVVSLNRELTAGKETRAAIDNKVREFISLATDSAGFRKAVQQMGLQKMQALGLQKNATYVNDIADARPIIRWAFKDAKVGQVSKVPYDFPDRIVIPMLVKTSDANNVKVDDFRDALVAQVRKELKGQQLIEKLAGATKLEDMKAKIGDMAIVGDATDVTMQSTSLPNIGYDPVAVGRLFGLKKDALAKPFAGENGVVALIGGEQTPAPKIADFSSYKQTIQQRRQGPVTYYLGEAIKELKKVVDDRISVQ